ncbi:MAG: autotransporter-associated beta strand repeat-containing protein [Planctomycetia bacterium]|nr:autotransporter-associated beta strand repeat-containing protein [Planctomycetia bacterium]
MFSQVVIHLDSTGTVTKGSGGNISGAGTITSGDIFEITQNYLDDGTQISILSQNESPYTLTVRSSVDGTVRTITKNNNNYRFFDMGNSNTNSTILNFKDLIFDRNNAAVSNANGVFVNSNRQALTFNCDNVTFKGFNSSRYSGGVVHVGDYSTLSESQDALFCLTGTYIFSNNSAAAQGGAIKTSRTGTTIPSVLFSGENSEGTFIGNNASNGNGNGNDIYASGGWVSFTGGTYSFDGGIVTNQITIENAEVTLLGRASTASLTASYTFASSDKGIALKGAGKLTISSSENAQHTVNGAIFLTSTTDSNTGVTSTPSLVLESTSGSQTVANNISGTGNLLKTGTGTVTLTGTVRPSSVTVDAGTLTITTGGSQGTGYFNAIPVVVNSGATIRYEGIWSTNQTNSDTTTFTPYTLNGGTLISANMNYINELAMTGNAEIKLDGTNSDIRVGNRGVPLWSISGTGNKASTIKMVNHSTDPKDDSFNINILEGGFLELTSLVDLTSSYAGMEVNKQGTGTLELTGASNYVGPTKVSAGTLKLSGMLSDSSVVSVLENATLELAGSGTMVNNISGAGNLLKTGTGTITLTNTASALPTGNLTVREGILDVSAATFTVPGQTQVDSQLILGSSDHLQTILDGTLTIGSTGNVTVGTFTDVTISSSLTFTLSDTAPALAFMSLSTSDATTLTLNENVFAYDTTNFTGSADLEFALITTDGNVESSVGNFDSLLSDLNDRGYQGIWSIYTDSWNTDGTALMLGFTANRPADVPEPSTWALMILGVLTLGYMRRRRLS